MSPVWSGTGKSFTFWKGEQMRILVACEESQAVTIELRRLGHEAYSCDIIECSGEHPEWHIQVDALELLKMQWDMIIAFPPCTYLTNAGAVRLRVNGEINQERMAKAREAKKFFLSFYNAPCSHIAVENPTPGKSTNYRPILRRYSLGNLGTRTLKGRAYGLKAYPLLNLQKLSQRV